jgi:hypothetical protein
MGEEYAHKHSLPMSFWSCEASVLKVGDPELMCKCLRAKTQNPNELFSDVIWNRVPKNVFVTYDTLALSIMMLLWLTFNDGSVGWVRVLQQLGINPEINMINICQ